MNTAIELLTFARSAGIRLEPRDDVLLVEAPIGILTPALRDALVRHKPELLALLTRRYVTLKCGPTLPIEPIELAIELERRGYRQTIDAAGEYAIEPGFGLSLADRAAIAKWRLHLSAIVTYEAPTCA